MSTVAYLDKKLFVFLKAHNKEEAFAELVGLICQKDPSLNFNEVLAEVWQRESLATTRVAQGIAIPHAKIEKVYQPLIAVGLSRDGFYYDPGDEDKVHLIVLIVASSEHYLQVLSDIAARLNDGWTYQKLLQAKDTSEAHGLLAGSKKTYLEKADLMALSKGMLQHAFNLYKETGASLLVVYADVSSDISLFLPELKDLRICLVTRVPERYQALLGFNHIEVLHVPYGSLSRSGQIELTHLFLAAKGYVKKDDKVISLYGKKDSNLFDTIMVSDIESEFGGYLSLEPELLPADLKQEVFARAVKILNDLASEGREGRPLGTIFVLADHEAVEHYCQQMVVNPFQGLPFSERNILDPSLEETVKEYAKLDGAFIVRGDGVILSSGTYLSSYSPGLDFVKGLGARHAAAALVTSNTKALALVLSESTRKISIFKSGKRFIVF